MENVFNVKYNTKLDRLELPKENRKIKIREIVQKHKFMSIVFAIFFALSSINFYLIYSFMKILENI